MERDVERAEPADERIKNNARIFSISFLPNLSPGLPTVMEPIMHPIIAELTAHPSIESDKWKYSVINGMVPEITAVSNPKRSPPNAAVKLHRYIYLLPDLVVVIIPGNLDL